MTDVGSFAVIVALLAGQPPAAACRAASDCVITSSPGCCGACCPQPPRAESRDALRREKAACAAASCVAPRCAGIRCEPVMPESAYIPACEAGRCVARPVPRCSTDDDCMLGYERTPEDAACHSSPCGCCPGTEPRALRIDLRPEPPTTPKSPTRPTPPPGPRPQQPRPDPVNCSPCPGPPMGARAACVKNACVVVTAP